MNNKKHILGVTGGVGTGKSTVLAYFQQQYHATVIECDKVAFDLEQKGEPAYQPVVDLLGAEILGPDSQIDRRKTGAIVFADKALLNKLNAIVHPLVKQRVRETIAASLREDPNRLVVIEAALLFEDHYDEICDEIWYIFSERTVRCKRLAASRGYSGQKIGDMMRAQKEDAYYKERAQLTIDNSSDGPENAYQQIDEGLRKHGFLCDCERQQR